MRLAYNVQAGSLCVRMFAELAARDDVPSILRFLAAVVPILIPSQGRCELPQPTPARRFPWSRVVRLPTDQPSGDQVKKRDRDTGRVFCFLGRRRGIGFQLVMTERRTRP